MNVIKLDISPEENPLEIKATNLGVNQPTDEGVDNIVAELRATISDVDSSGYRTFLTAYMGLKNLEDFKRIKFVKVSDLIGEHKDEYTFLDDHRLKDVTVAIVPGDMWVKGSQPSESHAEKSLILFNEDYFKGKDRIAWMVHELAHCLSFKDSSEDYQQRSRDLAYQDLESQYSYPNNQVERYAFKKQFEYLKRNGVNKEEILTILKEEYKDPEDFKFFERVLGEVF